jgi:cyclopropane fatty-acyl-phospholipid synthase-like methyltransferase
MIIVLLITERLFAGENSNNKVYQGQHKQHNYKHHGGQHRFTDAEVWANRFEQPERDKWQKPEAVIEAMDFKGHEVVADIGSATGYFPVRFAKALTSGKVYGIDIEQSMVDYLNKRAEQEGLTNLTSVLGETGDPKLPEPVDIIFICNTYHHLEKRQDYFGNLKNYFKASGRLVIVDFQKGNLPVGPSDNMKLTPDAIIKELSEAGYQLVKQPEILPYQYFLVFSPVKD